jgi:hemerythrin-like metal-binding protein
MPKLLAKFSNYLYSALLLIGAALLFTDVGFGSPGLWLIILVAILLQLSGGRKRCEGFVSWKPEYSVGIKSVDDQHMKLLTLINNVRSAVLCDTGTDFERSALDELIAYTQSHLKYEEALMAEHKYFDFEAHKGQHDQMIIQVGIYVKRYEEKGSEILPEIAEYLQRWLMQHIQVTDKKLCGFLVSKGVE